MKVTVAYIEEPPFYWTGADHRATGADIELADVVLRATGATSIEYHLTTFEELLPGVRAGRWDMNVPTFATDERAKQVAFSVPVWALGDGFVVQRGNPKVLTSYEVIAARSDARLGVITGQVQHEMAKAAGVGHEQIVIFKDQAEAVSALLQGRIDAFVGTALGNRALANSNPALGAVAHADGQAGNVRVGAFSFAQGNKALLPAVNEYLRRYLGSEDHRALMAKYGFARMEIDGALAPSGAKS